jgi:hypothetical protein
MRMRHQQNGGESWSCLSHLGYLLDGLLCARVTSIQPFGQLVEAPLLDIDSEMASGPPSRYWSVRILPLWNPTVCLLCHHGADIKC